MSLIRSLILLALCAHPTLITICQSVKKSEQPFPRYTLKQGQLDADGLPISGAKLCIFGGRGLCYQMPAETVPGSPGVVYEFGLEPHSERLPLSDRGSWVFFTGTFSGGGSGTLERLAILRFEGSADTGKIVNLMPFKGVTNVSDRAVWTVPSASPYPILVDADFIWGKGETHFSAHFFTVETWRFDPAVDHYVRAFSYRTNKRYDGGDTKPVRVLVRERETILRRLQAK